MGTRAVAFVGRYVLKEFPRNGVFLGKVMYYECGLYRVSYEDGDCEDLDSGEVRAILLNDGDFDDDLARRKGVLEKLVLKKNGKVENVSAEGSKEGLAVGALPPLPPPLELPPSSGTIGVPEQCVSLLFAVYAFLRSFSIRLFLMPFTLDEFVGSLNCRIANSLFDAIHVSLMRVLRRHLETVSSEGSELASKCLRCYDWSMLDSLTWPVYLIMYLVVNGYKDGPEWKEFYDEVSNGEYYVLPVYRKLQILQILCDDVLASEEVIAEMNKRKESEVPDNDGEDVLPSEVGLRRVQPRYANTSACEDKEATKFVSASNAVNQPGNSISYLRDTESTEDCDVDRNGDECRLCGLDGTLLCCDGCPSAYHSRCIGVIKMHIPEGPWYCPECKINMTEPTIAKGTSLRGAEIFGRDLYGQLFMGTCEHLLVLNIDCDEFHLRYYNQNDIPKVLQVLYESMQHRPIYHDICMAVLQYWSVPENFFHQSDMNHQNFVDRPTVVDPAKCSMANGEFSNYGHANDTGLPITVSLLTKESTQSGFEKCERNVINDFAYKGLSYKPLSYINYYIHGDFAASAAAKFALLLSEESRSDGHVSDRRTASVNTYLQAKAFSLTASRFFWPSSEKKHVEVPRERCGWCFSCKAPVTSKRGCMLNHAALSGTKSAIKILAGFSPIRSGEGILPSIATYIIYMEECLRGLVVGPFLSASYRRQWRKRVEQATTFSAIKPLLLQLEENIRTIAFCGDWVKLMDDWLVEFPMAQSATSTVGTVQKRAPSGRRYKKRSAIDEASTDGCSKNWVWWRGGKFTKFIFQKAVLPKSMVRKAARQGGSRKISGISYADGFEIPKRSRQLVWRVAVQMSRNASQLALQVRYLDFYLRWSDLIRPEQNIQDGKGQETEASAFRNANICDSKVVEGRSCYGIAFGSQKHLPSRVMKNVVEIEQGPEGKEKYWFHEMRIPLYLVKEYEEGNGNAPCNEEHLNTASELLHRRRLKAVCKDIFFYLTCKRDNLDVVSCSVCQMGVLNRNAHKCNACQVFLYYSSNLVHKCILFHSKRPRKICSWGIIWKKKNNEDTGNDFSRRNILLKGGSSMPQSQPVCHLCSKPYSSDLMYICCEACQHWYHAEAVELEESKISSVLGFKCCKCRRIKSPTCPYADPKPERQEGKKSRKRPSKKEHSGAVEDDPLLFSLSSVELVTEPKIEGDVEWNGVPWPGLQKLPVRRKHEGDGDVSFGGTPLHGEFSTYGEAGNPTIPAEEPSEYASAVNDSDNVNVNYDYMDFEPHTYFSVTELLHSDDGNQFDGVDVSEDLSGYLENSSALAPGDHAEPAFSLQDTGYSCCKCLQMEPVPDRCCENCGMLIHSQCSPWPELPSMVENWTWRCGNCREW
uniref:Nucleosome-remodeling factor subunit BPTF n=1 Tax=Cajanus cajan TaxID=3821 RepID=A0A151TNN7_CAJCA|nr:Nucleosome-remodeling factor subunit BPTF [Cajanus cajan]